MTSQYIIKEIYGISMEQIRKALRAVEWRGFGEKLRKVQAKPRYILTEIGVGYRLVNE